METSEQENMNINNQIEENNSSSNVPQVTPESSTQIKKSMKKRNVSLLNQELLKLVSRGSAIICEILRLKDFIPEPYSNPSEEKLYKDIIFDFSIFNQGKIYAFEDRLKKIKNYLIKTKISEKIISI